MSASTEKRRKAKTIYLIKWALALLFTFQIHFVRSFMDDDDTDEMVTLSHKRGLRGKLPPGNGKELKVLAVNFPPFFTYEKRENGDYVFGGPFKYIAESFAESLNMSIKYIILDQADVTKYGLNGAADPYLDNKLVDFIPTPRAQNLDTMKHTELITPLSIEPFMLLQPYPNEENHLYVIIAPFELPVWLCVLTTTASFILVSAIIIKHRANINDLNSSRQSLLLTIYNQIDFVIRIFTNQGTAGTHAKTRTSFKIFTGLWLLSIVVLINAYSGVLTSLLTVTKFEPIAETMKDVAESKELRVTCDKSSIFCKMFLNATEGYEKTLGDQLRKEPTLFVSHPMDILKNVIQHKAAYPGTESLVKYMLREDTKRNGHCRMTLSSELRAYPKVVWQLQFPVGNPYAAIFSKTSLRNWDNGLAAYDRNRAFSFADQCRVDKTTDTKKRALTLIHLSAAFLILGVGLSLSIFCFVIEILSKHVLIWHARRI